MSLRFYKGLRFRIALAFSVLFALVSVLFSQYTYHFFSDLLKSNYNRYLFSRANAILSRTEFNPTLIALPDSGEAIQTFYHDHRKERVTLFHTPGLIQQVVPPYRSGVSDTLGLRVVYVKRTDYADNTIELLFGVSNQYLHQKLNYLRWLMIASTLLSVFLSAAISYWVAGWLLGPIRALINGAKRIDLSNLTQRVPVSQTEDELQELGETFNAMLARIKQEQQQQTAFFAAASHELKTPLAVLQAQTEYHLTQPTAADHHQLLLSQLQEIKRLQDIVSQFLATSQIQYGQFKSHLTQVDLSEQLLRIFERNKGLLLQKQLRPTLHFDKHAATYFIRGDAEKLDMVWQNLLQNALYYTPIGGSIRVDLKIDDEKVEIIFTNDTVETAVDVAKLGTAFYTNSGLPKSTGLGLWLSRAIIHLHHGKLSLHSDHYQFIAIATLPMT
ncbi:HAMP domain-containing protein [Mucilaginibacter sp. 21P]|uniref:HAMP domain-containing protein n=1 Tax=Mucilaginibacter sp. 21P TaxID=2778902 RepID=UPI001C570553|nr:HAMP domain-containing protein [Mucilaginibacter sp. 21P]QXV63756.1 HAMP domain-containing protein [Mucilaginibacter sp. 21P]